MIEKRQTQQMILLNSVLRKRTLLLFTPHTFSERPRGDTQAVTNWTSCVGEEIVSRRNEAIGTNFADFFDGIFGGFGYFIHFQI